MAKINNLISQNSKLIIYMFFAVVLMVGIIVGIFYKDHNDYQTSNSRVTKEVVCNCPSYTGNQPVSYGPGPCHCPE